MSTYLELKDKEQTLVAKRNRARSQGAANEATKYDHELIELRRQIKRKKS